MHALMDQTAPLIADEAEATIAATAAERLKALAVAGQDINVRVNERADIVLPLPARAVELIYRILESMAHNVPVSVIPHDAEFTTQQAADYLNVSRPFLVKLLDDGAIDHRKVGRHRKVRFADVLAYQEQSRQRRRAALADLAAEEKRLGLT